MIRFLTGAAAQADGWLHQRLGRSYAMMLSAGLIADIVHRILDAPRHVQERHHLIGMVLAVVMELALLLHQLGEMHERFGYRARDAEETPYLLSTPANAEDLRAAIAQLDAGEGKARGLIEP